MFNDSFKQFYKFFNFFDILFIYLIINNNFNLNRIYFNIITNFMDCMADRQDVKLFVKE